MPYRRPIDEVMWRCVQAGLTQKWVTELNRLYAKQAKQAGGTEVKEEVKEVDSEDGLVRRCANSMNAKFVKE